MKKIQWMNRIFHVLYYIVLLVVALSGPCMAAEKVKVPAYREMRSYTVADGLLSSSVYGIVQDSLGFIWFGTKDGLNRFDGHEFRSFRSEPSAPGNGIGDNFIRALHEDSEGRIWAGTNSGVYIYDPKTESFSFFGEKADDGTVIEKEVNDIKSDKSGNIWIGNWQGLFKYNTISRQLFHFGHDPDVSTSLSSNQVLSVCVDSDNIIWAGTLGGGYQPISACDQ